MLSKINANKLVVSVGVLIFTLVLLVNQGKAYQCGKQVDFKKNCSEGYCCSKWGWCGKGDAYCGPNSCQSQCPPPPPPPPPPPSNPYQCGKQVNFKKNCSEGYCCSNWGFCGTTDWYCGPKHCQSQCPPPSPPPSPTPPSPPPPAPTPLPPNPITDILTKELFEEMLMYRNDARCPAHGFYSYDAFITAASTYPEFGNTGDLETRKRELAAFFAQTSHETTGGWDGAPGGRYAWGYCFKAEVGATNDYCVPSNEWPCVPGKKYYGRGPMQLSYNYNYGQAGAALDLPLLNDPDLVENDPFISFKTALWFWMTPQPPKPSAHDVITGKWKPTQEDIAAGRVPGYGVITNIINGGLECGIPGPDPRVEDRIGFYKRYCDILGVSYGENLDCYDQCPFTGCRGLRGVFSF